MKICMVILILCLLMIQCQVSKKTFDDSKHDIMSDTTITFYEKSPYYSIQGIDSIVKSNHPLIDSLIDSISIRQHVFDAVYLSAWKGKSHIQHFDLIKVTNPLEYNRIAGIHTAHLLIVNGNEFLFNGKGDVGCKISIAESTKVEVVASVYTFYSNNIVLGKYVILDTIKVKQ